jgi:glycyl-tRNA synthetase alpha chain
VNFQTLLLRLQQFWADRGCVIQQPCDLEVGAGTMSPDTFLRVLGPEPWNVCYVQPSRRPDDGRYGENPFRLGKHWQLQVILKPHPPDTQAVYEEMLRHIGIDLEKHDLRYEEDNWESPTLGAWGVGWQVMLDGLEITQFTYFQQAGGVDLAPIPAEITLGLERLLMFITGKRSVFDLEWAPGISYGEIRQREEHEFSKAWFEAADIDLHRRHFDDWEGEARKLLDAGLTLPAYDATLKCSHLFNVLDARGAVSVTERTGYIKRVRVLALRCAKAWLALREEMGYPLLKGAAAGAPR